APPSPAALRRLPAPPCLWRDEYGRDRRGLVDSRLHAQRRARGDVHGDRPRLRRRRAGAAAGPAAVGVDRLGATARGRPSGHGDPLDQRSRARAGEGRRARRRHGARPAAPGGGPRRAGRQAPARPRGPSCRGRGAAERRRGARLGGARRRQRPRGGPQGEHRLHGGAGAPERTGRRRHRVLERRGRRARAGGQGAEVPGVPRRRVRRAAVPRARGRREPADARRGARSHRRHREGPAAWLRGGPARPAARGREPRPAQPRPRPGGCDRRARRGPERVQPRGPEVRRARPPAHRGVGRLGREVRTRRREAERRPRVRLHRRRL
ncbi:MAG: hypothetical protein AVDCRST_MAG85-2825, partial [uncultured Solirubrobacteraceae bacterium]